MRVLVVTVVHVPLDARIHHRQIRSLLGAGHEVTYAAPFEATSIDPGSLSPSLELLDLPRAVGRRRVHALTAARALLAREGPRHDVVVLHDPELVLAVVGRRRWLPPVVLDVHEDLVASLSDRDWLPRPLRPVARGGGRWLERWAERRLDLLLAEEGYAARFRRQHPVVRNLPWAPADPPPAGTHHRVVQVGRLSIGRGVEELLAVGRALQEEGGPTLELIGAADRGVESQVGRAHERGEIRWHGFLPNDAAQDLVLGSVAGLALLHDEPNYRVSMPTKVVEYLAAGVPAITTPLPEAVRLVQGAGEGHAGTVVPFGDVDATVAAIRRYAEEPELRLGHGARGRAHVLATCSWDAEQAGFLAALEHVVARAGGGRHPGSSTTRG